MQKKPSCIVTVTDGISPTSMPFNEFILYRLKHYPEEKQILIQLFERGVDKNVTIPSDVELYSLGMSVSKIFQTIRHLERNYDVKAYHVHEGKSVILFSFATLMLHRNKTVYTLHSTYRNYPFHNKLFSFCASLLAYNVVCVSKTSYKYYPQMLKKLRGRHAMYIQNGVDTERIEAVGHIHRKEGSPFTMVYVARLVPLKRHHILLEALRELPHVRLKLIGQGPLEEELKRMVAEYGLSEQVEFLGLLPREEVYQELEMADLYVSSSSYEGLPIGVLEAMCCGIPCLVSDIEQHREIKEKVYSLYTCDDTPQCWTEKLTLLSKMDHEQLREIGELNRKGVKQHFSLEEMHKQYDAVYA